MILCGQGLKKTSICAAFLAMRAGYAIRRINLIWPNLCIIFRMNIGKYGVKFTTVEMDTKCYHISQFLSSSQSEFPSMFSSSLGLIWSTLMSSSISINVFPKLTSLLKFKLSISKKGSIQGSFRAPFWTASKIPAAFQPLITTAGFKLISLYISIIHVAWRGFITLKRNLISTSSFCLHPNVVWLHTSIPLWKSVSYKFFCPLIDS